MKSLMLSVALVFALAAPALAQNEVNVGETFQLAFDQSTTQPQPGWTLVYKAYVDGVAVDAVSGPLEGQANSRVFAMPPFTTGGSKSLKVSVQALIEDPLLWKCGTSGTGTVNCTEVMSAELLVTAIPPTVPDPDPATGLRIIRTTTVSEVLIDAEGRILRTDNRTTTRVIPVK